MSENTSKATREEIFARAEKWRRDRLDKQTVHIALPLIMLTQLYMVARFLRQPLEAFVAQAVDRALDDFEAEIGLTMPDLVALDLPALVLEPDRDWTRIDAVTIQYPEGEE